MKRFLLSMVAVLAASVAFLAGAPSASAHSFDCPDFRSQADAQAHYNADTSDPDGLDGRPGPEPAGEPGVACEEQDYPQPGNPAIYSPPIPPLPETTTTSPMRPITDPVQAEDSNVRPPSGPVAAGGGGAAVNASVTPGGPMLGIGGMALVATGALLLGTGLLRRSRVH